MTARGGLGRGLGELFTRTDLPPASQTQADVYGDDQQATGQSPANQAVSGAAQGTHGKKATAPRVQRSAADGTRASGDTATSSTRKAKSTQHSVPNSASNRSDSLGDGSYYREIPIANISPNPQQPRQVFDEDELVELADSLREVGLLQPIVVRDKSSDASGEHFELIMGERRWRAAQVAGLGILPAIVRATEDSSMLTDALLENLHRVQLNPLEEAAAYQQLISDFGITQDELSNRIKRSRPHISNTIRLLKLPAPVQRRVAAGVLSAGHARALLSLEDSAQQERLATKVVAEGLSVRATEELVTLGSAAADKPRHARAARIPSEQAQSLSRRLEDRFDTRVRVDIGKQHGRITLEFAGQDDLERLLALLDPIE